LAAPAPELADEALYRCMQNRELSWLRFNERVLEEADDEGNPLFERLFFLSVFTTNLDEFFMVRVGGLQEIEFASVAYTDNKTGLGAGPILEKVFDEARRLYPARDRVYEKLEAELARTGNPRRKPEELSPDETERLDEYFHTQIEPLLAPQVVDTTHPFPHIENKRLIIAAWIHSKKGHTFGMIPLPRGAERLYDLDDGGYILIEDVILHYCGRIFRHYTVEDKSVVCITRNADIDTVDEPFDADEDFREHVTKLLKKQKRLAPVRLEVRGEPCEKLTTYLRKRLGLKSAQTFYSVAPLDLSYHGDLRDRAPLELRAKLSFAPFEPSNPVLPGADGADEGMFRRIRQKDMLLSFPYESISPFLTLIREAAEDIRVTSIQITLYRLADQSRLAETLIAAAENGKDVFIFIELRARMDEENNIGWAKRLEAAGCTVFYGAVGFKMHSKICLITRREAGKNEFFTQIGTGNYNEKTAKLYTDLSLITADRDIARDAAKFFRNMMVGALDETYRFLWVAPKEFKPRLIERVRAEAALGADGRILIKCNSLTDRDVIEELVKASVADVKIDLIIRGICCLVPGVPGLTENIRARSVVGRFLEHSRIYRFGKGEDCALYIGSGDMMTRNMTRRIELFAPVRDEALRAKLFATFDALARDNVKARELTSNGRYIPADSDAPPFDSQQAFIEQAAAGNDDDAAETDPPPAAGLIPSVWSNLRRIFRRDDAGPKGR
jgi:polyphosphate kinase